MTHYKLNRDNIQELAQIISPLFDDQNTRKSLVTAALIGSSLMSQIDFSGNAFAFTINLIRQLSDYGTLDDGQLALIVFVDTCKQWLGADKRKHLDEIIRAIESSSAKSNEDTSIEPQLPKPTNESKYKHVFVSYSSLDRPLVSQIAQAIQQAGYPIWVDSISIDFDGYLIGGENWRQGLANGLNQAILVVLAVSPDSMKSPWVAAEIRRARENQRPIIPVTIHSLDEISSERWQKLELDKLHTRDLTSDYDRGLQQLLKDISKYVNPIKLADQILETGFMLRDQAIIMMLNDLLQDNSKAAPEICRIITARNDDIVGNILFHLVSHPVAKSLPPQIITALRSLTSSPNMLIAGWANELINR